MSGNGAHQFVPLTHVTQREIHRQPNDISPAASPPPPPTHTHFPQTRIHPYYFTLIISYPFILPFTPSLLLSVGRSICLYHGVPVGCILSLSLSIYIYIYIYIYFCLSLILPLYPSLVSAPPPPPPRAPNSLTVMLYDKQFYRDVLKHLLLL